MDAHELSAYLEEKRIRTWKSPLFIIGAGVSSARVPMMSDIFDFFKHKIPESPSHETLKRLRQYCLQLQEGAHSDVRAVASHFFSILQNPRFPEVQSLWKEFSASFITGKLLGQSDPIWKLDPTEFHRLVAKEVVRTYLPAYCISLNYDGLTTKAILEEATHKNWREAKSALFPVRILSLPSEIDAFFLGDTESKDQPLFPVIKLKGDIFYATCRYARCKSYQKQTAVYEFFLEQSPSPVIENAEETGVEPVESVANSAESSNQLLFQSLAYKQVASPQDPEILFYSALECRDCHKQRQFELDFPGYAQKEQHTLQIMNKICRYLLPSLSCVVVCGVSGDWDAEVCGFLNICHVNRGIEIICLSNEERPSLLRHLPWATAVHSQDANSSFKLIPIDFRDFHVNNANKGQLVQ